MLNNTQHPTLAPSIRPLSEKGRAIWLILGALLLFGIVFGAAFVMRTAQGPPHASSALPATTVTLPIEGMTCTSCVARVKTTLQAIEGVTAVEVSLAQRAARVSYRAAQVSPERLAAAINDLGYRAGTPVAEDTR